MLRMLMHDDKTRDDDFKAMMHDFVQTHLHKNATTESFFAIVEKHMKPGMDLTGTHRIDWFVSEWVYGTDLPKYKFEYSLTPGSEGHVTLTGTLTQSEVSENFVMGVPIYFDFDGQISRSGLVRIQGNRSVPIKINLPKKPKRVLLNARHDILSAEATVKEM
jgi:aminopeptidase N